MKLRAYRASQPWTRLKWEPDDIRDLRNRVTSNTTALNAFTTSNIRDDVVKLVASPDEQKRRKILDWLTPVDSSAQQSDFIRRRQPGTGQWMLESPEYKEWKAGTGDILFCHGIPGAGKTILSSIAVDDLQGCEAADNVAVCHFYCNFQRQEEQRLENIVLRHFDPEEDLPGAFDVMFSEEDTDIIILHRLLHYINGRDYKEREKEALLS